MKKRAMKKYIPNGVYCHDPYDVHKTCPWWKSYKVQRRHRNPPSAEYIACDFAKGCDLDCDKYNCHDNLIVGCKYLGMLDKKQDTLLWDQCKECNVRNVQY